MKKWPIYLLEAPSIYDLTSTFLRFAEHYESPKFHGTVFTLEEFMDWYAAQNGGKFRYFEDWWGYNLPSSALKLFRAGAFNPLSKKEERLLKRLENIPEPFYLIGAVKGCDPTNLKHEFMHGLYYFDPKYQEAVAAEVDDHAKEHFWKVLESEGYTREVLLDEINAYSTTDLSDLLKAGLDPSEGAMMRFLLQTLFRDYFGYAIEDQSRGDILKRIHTLQW